MSSPDLEARLDARRTREVLARAHGLKVAVEVTGYKAGDNTISDETLSVYANKFANFILNGEMTL